MAQSAAHVVDCVIPRVPVRQWVPSFPIPLRILFAGHPDLLSPLLQIILRSRLRGTSAGTGAEFSTRAGTAECPFSGSANGRQGSIAPLRFLNLQTFDQLFMLVGVPNL